MAEVELPELEEGSIVLVRLRGAEEEPWDVYPRAAQVINYYFTRRWYLTGDDFPYEDEDIEELVQIIRVGWDGGAADVAGGDVLETGRGDGIRDSGGTDKAPEEVVDVEEGAGGAVSAGGNVDGGGGAEVP